MVGRLVLVLGDQLTETLSALAQADKARDTVVMAEVADEAAYVQHHPKKIALIFAAMRKFAQALEQDGWTVAYTQLDDTDNAGSIVGELLRRAAQTGASEVLATVLLLIRLRPQRKTGLLMDGDQPAGGKWNFDHDNRKAAPDDVTVDGPLRFEPDATTREVLDLVQARFGDNFGDLEPFWFATTRAEALQALDHFIANALPRFGDYQDAMLNENEFLYHAILSPYLNIGLLNVTEICKAAADAYAAGHAPINAAEGFIRQIIGWREYVRGIYFLEGPDYTSRNVLGHDRALPWFYWGGETRMNCVVKAVGQTKAQAYAHHIQRLMVTGNFALLAGIDPAQVHEWYLAVYADAFEWVEAPNTIGMSQFADGGVIASKPYVSSGAYINRMSDHCKSCHYSVSAKTGDKACPFNLLYWHFLDRHRDRFSNNPRMGNMYRTWDRMDADKRKRVLAEGDALLARLDAGEVV